MKGRLCRLSIVGFDGLPQGELFYPALTTVAQPMREMGRVACRRLFEAMERPGRVEKTEFTMELISRESTGRAPAVRGRADLHLLPSSGSS